MTTLFLPSSLPFPPKSLVVCKYSRVRKKNRLSPRSSQRSPSPNRPDRSRERFSAENFLLLSWLTSKSYPSDSPFFPQNASSSNHYPLKPQSDPEPNPGKRQIDLITLCDFTLSLSTITVRPSSPTRPFPPSQSAAQSPLPPLPFSVVP